ncbi:hypothetical protein ADK38_03880 [Streptomyces varsoviensis]|uniref:Uncharacterized protein n=1 Tax=Streptomyces varsoviensis TaxID=67373 RepID=A0ABR5JCZ0_9ACTN|nr:hypothetical protein ADK38_03880 [Streptomyces varsoviensis]
MSATAAATATGTDAEFYFFSGSPDALARRLFALPRDVVRRRLWALLLQGPHGAHIQTQERETPDSPTGRVRSWEGADLGPLPARLVALLPTASYRELRAALLDHGSYTDLGTVPCPPSPRGAFGHPLKAHAAETVVRAYVLAL